MENKTKVKELGLHLGYLQNTTREERFDKRFSMMERGILVVGKDFKDGSHAMWEAGSIKNFIKDEVSLLLDELLSEVKLLSNVWVKTIKGNLETEIELKAKFTNEIIAIINNKKQ